MKTKAVTDKKIYDNNLKYTLVTKEVPTTLLGVWIIDHKFKGTKYKNDLNIEGSFEVNVWYSYENDTKTAVATRIVTYNETIPSIFNENSNYRIRTLGNPSCQKSLIENGTIIVDVFKQFEIEIVDEIEIQIKEETEKPKEIETIIFNYQDNHNQVEINEYLRCSINEVIDKVNYLLEKEADKQCQKMN